MDVRAGGSRPDATGEGLGAHGQPGTGHPGPHRRGTTTGAMREHAHAASEVVRVLGDHYGRVGGERMGVDRGDEDRVRLRVDRRQSALLKGRARVRSLVRVDQLAAHRRVVEPVEFGVRVAREFDRIIAVEVDHHRLHALLATMDGADGAGTRRGEDHTGRFLSENGTGRASRSPTCTAMVGFMP